MGEFINSAVWFLTGFIIGVFFFDLVAFCKQCIEEYKIAKRDWRK